MYRGEACAVVCLAAGCGQDTLTAPAARLPARVPGRALGLGTGNRGRNGGRVEGEMEGRSGLSAPIPKDGVLCSGGSGGSDPQGAGLTPHPLLTLSEGGEDSPCDFRFPWIWPHSGIQHIHCHHECERPATPG